ncbi:yippee-like protein [Spathaspora sp. JA1]|nr:yippee-like protein [Spathaspora sp. JA1]
MGLRCTNYFENSKYESPDIQIITCKGCSSHLCLSDLILSDNFNGASGPAYLVDNLINIEFNLKSEETPMKTGVYLINKIKCHQCKSPLGWYYKKSYSCAETYKEGKFVIEKNFIKFVDNHTTMRLLMERAMKNRYRRRLSSLSVLTVDELDSIEDEKAHSPAVHYNQAQLIKALEPEHNTNKNNFNFFTYQIKKRRSSSSDYRQGGIFLNRLRLPQSKEDIEEIEVETNSINSTPSATTHISSASTINTSSPTTATTAPPATRTRRSMGPIVDDDDDDILVDI